MRSLELLSPPTMAVPSAHTEMEEEDDILRALELAASKPFALEAKNLETPTALPAIHFTEGGVWVASKARDADIGLAELVAEARDALLFLSECACLSAEDLGERPYEAAHELFLRIDRLELLSGRASNAAEFVRRHELEQGDAELEAVVISSCARWVGSLIEPATMGVFAATPSGMGS